MARQGRIIQATVPVPGTGSGRLRRRRQTGLWIVGLGLLLAACQAAASESPTRPSAPATPGPGTTASAPPGSEPTVGGDPPGVMLVLGDFGAGTEEEFAVAEAMKLLSSGRPVDALVTTGDNLYVDDPDLAWNRPFGWVAEAGIPVWAAFGNHDVESEARRRLAEELFGSEFYRTEQWGRVRLITLDANRPDDPAQLAWLDEQLENAGDETLVVAFHQPAVSCSSHGATPLVVENWMERFETADVDLVLQGHDHNYQHHLVKGIDYVVTGGGGYSLYPISPCPDGSRPLAAAAEHHFLVLEQVGDQIQVSAIRPDGTQLDRFSISP